MISLNLQILLGLRPSHNQVFPAPLHPLQSFLYLSFLFFLVLSFHHQRCSGRFRISVGQWYVLCYSFSCGWFAIGLCTSSDTFSSTTTPRIRTIITCLISGWLILLILFKRYAIGTNNGLLCGFTVVTYDIRNRFSYDS